MKTCICWIKQARGSSNGSRPRFMSFITNSARIPAIRQGDPRVIRGWIMYDWANSVYQLTISSAIFPVYYNVVTCTGDDCVVSFFGMKVVNSVLYSYTIAAAFLIVGIFSPLFSGLADYTGRRKTFMKVFTLIGSVSCMALFFFDRDHLALGVIAFGLGTLGYAGSIVFYNSFLPVIAAPGDQDRISARGYSMGYIGGVVLLLFNIWMIQFPGFFGIPEGSSLPARISFLSVGIWWLGFAQITFLRLPKYTFRQRTGREGVITNGYRELHTVFSHIRKSFNLSCYLAGFLLMMMGVLTVMFMAASFGAKELKLPDEVLIPTILLIQFVGIGGAWSFSRLSERIGNFRALILAVIIWIFVCVGAYTIESARGFVTAAIFIGFVMGGSQSLSRSTYSKMLPETTDHTSYFSFYDVMEKFATVCGLVLFGLMNSLTGGMRTGVLMIAVFFLVSLGFFLLLAKRVQIFSLHK
jgi:MFS transporter, UMF1 family